MVELEKSIIPRLRVNMPLWKRYMDDTFTFVKKHQITNVISVLNSFHPNIKFTYETERGNRISFLDVLLTRTENGQIDTSVYRKPTNNNIYIHWNAYGPKQWKTGTLSGIIRRAYDICSTKEALSSEVDFIQKVFTEINGYPRGLVSNMLKKVEEENKIKNEANTTGDRTEGNNDIAIENNTMRTLVLKVPFRGNKGESLIKSFKSTMKKALPDNVQCRIVHNGTKLSKYFNLKDKIDEKHLSNFVYRHDCRKTPCKDNYVGETGRRKTKRTQEHAGVDKNSAIFKHSQSEKHPCAEAGDFQVLAANYPNRRKRKLAEAMFIRDLKPTLNRQKDSFKLALFL